MKRLFQMMLAVSCLTLAACARQHPAYVYKAPAGNIVLTIWVGSDSVIGHIARKVNRMRKPYAFNRPPCSWARELEFHFTSDPGPKKLKNLFDTLKALKYITGYATTRRVGV